MRGAAASGKRDHDIDTLFTVRFTIVSVMIFPFTVRSPEMRAEPESSRFAVVGFVTPIPSLPAVVSTIFWVLLVRKRTSLLFVLPIKSFAPIVLPESDQNDPERDVSAVVHDANPVASEVRTLCNPGVPPVILTWPATSSLAHGALVPIPMFPPLP